MHLLVCERERETRDRILSKEEAAWSDSDTRNEKRTH